ncbi:PKD domain-containing protein [Geomonas azotofigens]|uniref:PKD domain-containing protein n=1 Tax=Geomonas azotofigens TaxID=2843196 RepID=UPI001C0F94EC|nr:PKD domain-containing protein [Geomonas azotofigens]MBU5614514.1 PKD domain-containing protein [Geomonas azotofigens]
MARAYKDGAGASYDGTTNQFVTVPFGSVLVDSTNPGAGQQANPTGKFFEIFSFGADSGAGQAAYKQKVDNSNAGVMRDCAECHVGGGMNEYAYANMPSAAYDPASRTSLRSFDFGTAVTAWNYFIDIFNPDVSKRGDVVKQDYAQTGVLEMDCLMCHQTGYDWAARKEAVRKGEFDASRAVGAKLVNSVASGTQVFYNYTTVKTNASGKLYVDLSASLNSKPASSNCSSCHQSQYNVDWKKRGEQWLEGQEVHYSLGCMACHQRKDVANPQVGTSGLVTETKLGLCDPAKGGASDFDAMWNKLDTVAFKHCTDCHEPTGTPTWPTYGAPNSASMHAAKGLTAKIAYDKNGAPASHMDIMDCTACHISKEFDGGAMVDGTGADAEGRVALHDEPQVARDMAGTAGNALYWNNGKLYGANLLTSSFLRDMNGMDAANGGLDANNDGRNAGMDTLLQTHINDLNNAAGAKAVTMEQNADGSWVNETEMTSLYARVNGDNLGTASTGTGTYPGGLKQLLGVSDPTNTYKLIPKMSFLMVPFKASHNIAPIKKMAWGKGGCTDCHGANKGFYNGAYPILGNMSGVDTTGKNKFRFYSNQVTTFTKVNGLADTTDSHPSVVTKKGDRTVPVTLLTRFDGPYVNNTAAADNQTLRNIDRSEVIYEANFQTRDTAWYTTIAGSAPAAVCSGPTSPFFCATPTGVPAQDAVKSKATSTKGWLIKVEVRPAGDTNVGHITFRSAQLGKDNATSMAEVLAALPASFTTNSDFTVTEAGGALTITAAAGKEIRISPQTDSAPLGLKGKVYKADPIVRGANSYATRDAYVGYLNALSTNVSDYGIGIAPQAVINTPLADDDAAQMGVQWATGADHAVTAALAQVDAGNNPVGTVTYTWSTNDAAAVITNANSRTDAKVKFTTTGSKTVTLTVVDEEGKTASTYVTVNAIVPPVSIAWDHALRKATFSNLPSGTNQVKVYWGDGGTTTLTSGVTDPLTLNHTYTTTTQKIIKIYCFNSGVQVGYMQATITP